MGKLSKLRDSVEIAATKVLDMVHEARMRRAAEQGHSVARGEMWYHGSGSRSVPVEFDDMQIGGIPIYRRGDAVDYSPYQFTQNPSTRDYARASFQENALIEEGRFIDALERGGEQGLIDEFRKFADEQIEMARADWPDALPEYERIRRGIDAGRNKIAYRGGPKPEGITEFAPEAMNDGLYGEGIYMTDSPEIAGGGVNNPIAEYGYATDPELAKLVQQEKELTGEIADLERALGNPEVENREVLQGWLDANKAELQGLGKANTGHPTVYPLSHRVKNPWLPDKQKFRRKDLSPERLRQLESYMDSTGKNIKGKWPISDESMRFYMGNRWVNDTLKELGYDGIRHKGGAITGAPEHTVTMAFEPNQVRSVNAAFDPDKADSANLLAGSAAAAVGLGAATQSQDADAAVEPSFKEKAMEGTGKALNFAFDAMELPSRGLHGLAAALGVLAEGGDWNAAIERGAEVSGQSIDETAQELGQYVADKTGSAPAAALTDAITRVATLEP